MEPKKFEYIDSLRGIAILLVVGVHILSYFKVNTSEFFPPLLEKYIYDFRCGVALFFIVSAYTLALSHDRRKGEQYANRNFFIRRFFRIAPTYYLAILCIVLYTLYESPTYINAIPTFWFASNITFTNTLSPYFIGIIVPGGWSVSVEFMFYLLFPLIIIWVKDTNRSLIFFCITILIASVFHYTFKDDSFLSKFEFMEINFYYQLPIFFLGLLAYNVAFKRDYKINAYTYILIAGICIILSNIPLPYYFMWSIAFTILIIVLSNYPIKAFSNSVLAKVGKVSFSMYILHFFIITIFNQLNIGHIIPITGLITSILNFIILYIIVGILSYLLANVTYKLIEIPGQNLGKKIIKKLDQQNKITV